MKSPEHIFDILITHTVQVTPKEELLKKLKSGKKLVIKLGMDPTAPDLHLGHAVVLSKLKEFQDFGHVIVFIIGDFTARIGDPTGKTKTRLPLSEEQIAKNTATYFEQVSRILDPQKITIRFNSEWLGILTSKEMVELCAKTTLARLIERDDFARRLEEKKSIGFHELLYPLLQGYDSVVLDADVELGGTDQTFNLLFARFLQEQYHKTPQVIITTPILEGLDGTEKMSKSLSNYIGLMEPAQEVYGKLMSISDTLMWRYMEVLLNTSSEGISRLQERVAAGNTHPMALKKLMAYDIITRFWSRDEAEEAQEKFEAVFEKKDYSYAQEVALPKDIQNPIWIVDFLKHLGAIKNSSEAKRLIEAGAVKINGVAIKNFQATIVCESGMHIKVGKHRIYCVK